MNQETLAGIAKILLFRIEGETGIAWKIAFQTEHELSESREFETKQTKDGSRSSAGAYEGTFSLSSLMAKDDEYVRELKEVLRERNPRKIHVWDIETADANEEANTIPGEYALCNLTDMTTTAGSENEAELSMDLSVEGRPYPGDVEVTPDLLAIIQRIDEERGFIQPTGPESA